MNPDQEISGTDLLFGSRSGGLQRTQSAPAQEQEISGTDLLFGRKSLSQPTQQPKPAPNADGDGNVIVRLGRMIQGKQDPTYKDTPDFRDEQWGFGEARRIDAAKLVGSEDKAYGDVLQKTLGDRFKRRFKDANGHELIEFTGPDGAPRTRYVNKPGLDLEDVGRGAAGAIPYVAGGAALAGWKALKNAGMTIRGLTQFGANAGLSVAGDVGGQALGSDQSVDWTKAGVTGALGAGAELLPGRVMAGIIGGGVGAAAQMTPQSTKEEVGMGAGIGAVVGYAAAALARRMRMSPGTWYDEASGQLTPAGQKLVKAQGQDPAEMTAAMQQEFARHYAVTRDGAQAMIEAQTAPFGIKLSKGQQTHNYQDLLAEKNMLAGNYGEMAQATMKQHHDANALALARAAIGNDLPRRAGVPGQPRPPSGYQQPEQGIGQMINPENFGAVARNADGKVVLEMPGLAARGDAIRSGMQGVKQYADDAQGVAWDAVGPIRMTNDGMEALPALMKQQLTKSMPEGVIIDANTPVAQRMIGTIDEMYQAGRPKQPPAPQDPYLPQNANAVALTGDKGAAAGRGLNAESKYLPDATGYSVDQTRRRIGAMTQDAATPTDQSASKTVYRAYNDMLDDAAGQGLVSGNVEGLKQARGLTKYWKDVFEPNMGNGPQAKRISEVMRSDNAAERVVNEIIGDVTVRSTPKAGQVETIRSIKEILARGSRMGGEDVAQSAKQAWSEVGSTYWERIVIGKNGELLSPQKMLTNIKSAETNQLSIMQEVLEPPVRMEVKRLERVLEKLATPDPNASNSAIAGMSMVRSLVMKISGMIAKSATAQAALALPMQYVAKPIVDNVGAAYARRAINPGVREYTPSLGAFGGVGGHEWERQSR